MQSATADEAGGIMIKPPPPAALAPYADSMIKQPPLAHPMPVPVEVSNRLLNSRP